MKTKNYLFLLLIIISISCKNVNRNATEVEIENKPILSLELENNEGKEITIYSPSRFYYQTINATNTNHVLNFYIGERVLIYDSENSNHRNMNGMKKGAILKIIEKNQKLKGAYSENFNDLNLSLNKDDIAIREYFELLKKPYDKIFSYNFEWKKFENGISRTKEITDSIFKSDINENTKINILMSQLSWNQLSEFSERKYLSNSIDTLKVSELLWQQYKEKRRYLLNKYVVNDTIREDHLVSYKDEENIDLNNLKKDINILFFTAKWCGPCKSYVNPLKRIQEKYPEKAEIIAVSFDNNEKDFEDYKKGKNFKFVSDLRGLKKSKNSKVFNINSLPHIIIVDSKKRVLLNRSQSDLIEKQIEGIINLQ